MPTHTLSKPPREPADIEARLAQLEAVHHRCVDTINLVASQVELRTKGKVEVRWPAQADERMVMLVWTGTVSGKAEGPSVEASMGADLSRLKPGSTLSERAEIVRGWVDWFMSCFDDFGRPLAGAGAQDGGS